MIKVIKFRANDLNPSSGKQIEFNTATAREIFGLDGIIETLSVVFLYIDNDNPSSQPKAIKSILKLSPSRGDYKIYQNEDGTPDLKSFFLNELQLTESNIDDYFAIQQTENQNQYNLYYINKDEYFRLFYDRVKLKKDNLNETSIVLSEKKDNYTIEELKNILLDYLKRKNVGNNPTPFISFGFEFGDSFINGKIIVEKFINDAGIKTTNAAYYLGMGVDLYKAAYHKIYGIRFGTTRTSSSSINIKGPLQQIFYGAPGTGKSYEVNKKTNGCSVIRTTFHPDSDYSTFVGCYKPTMTEKEVRVIPVVDKNSISLDPVGSYKEEKIVYKFVKQAFLKAYLAAWKKYADINTSSSSSSPLTIKTSGGQYTITGANGQNVSYKRIINYRLPNGNLVTTWDKIWQTGSFIIPKGGPGRSLEQAISKWIYDKICEIFGSCTKDDFEKGLEIFIQNIKDTGEVEASKKTPNGQIYVFSPSDNDGVFIVKTKSRSSKTTVENAFNNEAIYEGADEIIKKLVDKLWEFDDDFETAWKRLAEAVEQNGTVDATKDAVPEPDPQFLIIEEINRGNCAQIFGDLFQLLDRSDSGFSEYPIEADDDLRKELEQEFSGLKLDDGIKDEINSIFEENYPDGITETILSGELLVLPKNLYIWATMNTSDQSLFPMDSAFKRRWDWKCVPIDYENKKSGSFIITIDSKPYCWHVFLKAINKRIKDVTQSEDKQMGNFFIKESVDETQFINKVMFYLWNDICKDEYHTKNNFFRNYIDDKKTEKEFTFNELFGPDAKTLLKGFMEFLDVSPDVEEPQNLEEEIATDSESA